MSNTNPASQDAGNASALTNGFDVMTATDPLGDQVPDVWGDGKNIPGATSAADGEEYGADEDDADAELEAHESDDEGGENGDEDDQEQEEGDQEDDGEDQEDWLEVEIDGVKEKIPSRLKDAFMKNRDYTQKTQALAEERKRIEAIDQELQGRQKQIEAQFAHVNKLSEQDLALQTQLASVNQRIAEFEQQAEAIEALANDPDRRVDYLSYVQAYQQLQNQRNQLSGQWQARQTQATRERAALIDRHQTQTWQWATENIDNFDTTKWGQMRELAKSVGINEQALTENITPAILQVLDYALKGKTLASAEKNPPAKKPEMPKTFKPSKGLRGRGNPRPQPRLDTMDMKEYMAARSKA